MNGKCAESCSPVGGQRCDHTWLGPRQANFQAAAKRGPWLVQHVLRSLISKHTCWSRLPNDLHGSNRSGSRATGNDGLDSLNSQVGHPSLVIGSQVSVTRAVYGNAVLRPGPVQLKAKHGNAKWKGITLQTSPLIRLRPALHSLLPLSPAFSGPPHSRVQLVDCIRS